MKRPYVIVNCAMSADGKIALPTGKQMRISSEEDIERMYHLRNECDAVLVGVGTILSDDPKLTVKEKYVPHPKQPLRVVLDRYERTPQTALVLNDAAKTLIITEKKKHQYQGNHIEVMECDIDKNGYLDIKKVLHLLYEKGIRKLLVEGGGTVIWNFLQNRVVDDLYTYIGPYIIGGKQTPTMADGEGIGDEPEAIHLKIVDVKPLGPGLLTHYKLL